MILPFAGLLWPSMGIADITVDAGRGPIKVNVPPAYETATPLPLLVLLHGFTSNGIEAESYLRFNALSDQLDFFTFIRTAEKILPGPSFGMQRTLAAISSTRVRMMSDIFWPLSIQ